jgi:RNA polymerase sigma-70 factor (ECF subfamily)
MMERDGELDRIVGSAYAVYGASVRRYLTGVTRDAAAAEDLAQDVFLRLTVEVGAGRVPDNIGAWLHRVGYNLAMSRARRKAVADRHLVALARPAIAASPEAAIVRHEQERAAVEALQDLTLAQQQAVILASYGIDGPEIARSIGRSQGATRTLLCRGRARMRMTLLAAEAD